MLGASRLSRLSVPEVLKKIGSDRLPARTIESILLWYADANFGSVGPKHLRGRVEELQVPTVLSGPRQDIYCDNEGR